MTPDALPNVLRDQAELNVLTGLPTPPVVIRPRPRVPWGVLTVAGAGVFAVIVALLGGGS
jgi:hypothetical protein